MPGLQNVEWAECFVDWRPDPALAREVRKTIGLPIPILPYFSAAPWLLRCFLTLHPMRVGVALTSPKLVELISLVVSQDNSCRFCYAETRTAMRLFGIPERRITELEQNIAVADLRAGEKAALEFSRRLSRASPLAEIEDCEALRDAGLEPLAVKEIAFLAAINIFFNRAMTLPAVPVDAIERMPESWWFRLLRPFLARVAQSRRRRGHLLAEPPAARGPYAYLVEALDRLPCAESLNDALDLIWQPSALPRRTKALVFAVVARGLGCPLSEQEASRVLEEEGMSTTEIESILGHLASPVLDAKESAIVPYARETIWYTPIQIQRRGRELRARLSNEEFLDVVGAAALANAFCRMSVITRCAPG